MYIYIYHTYIYIYIYICLTAVSHTHQTGYSAINTLKTCIFRLSQISTQLYSITNYHCSVSIHVLADPVSSSYA